MFSRIISVAAVCVVMAAAGPAHAFGGAEEKMMLSAFVNVTKAETYDKSCNRGKITGKVTDRGHSANFAKNKEFLRTDLMARLGQSTKGDPGQVLDTLSQEATDRWTKSFKKINGCFQDDAKHAERVLNLISETEPQFLMRELGKFVSNEAVKLPE